MSRQRIHALLFVVTLLALLSALAACGGGNALLGKWEDGEGITIEFKSDGTFVIGADTMTLEGTYVQEDDQVTLTVPDMGEPAVMTYAISGDTMTMTDVDGAATEFTRVK